MVKIVTSKSNINLIGSFRAVISVLMVLLLIFLPLSSWGNSLIPPVEKLSESFIFLDLSDNQADTMPCHSSGVDMTRSNQESFSSDCCAQSGVHTQCDNCEQGCTFAKHYSNVIYSFLADFSSPQLALKPIDFIATQFPAPPFRPPAA